MQPRLIATAVPTQPEAAVLVLHGGGSRRGNVMVSPAQLSVLRMLPIARRVARAGRGRLAVFRLLNSHRGWATAHTPVDDALWALDQLRERFGREIPTCLIGHSLGGRAALLAGTATGVRSVVALAPFVYPEDSSTDLTGRQVLVVDGSQDRIAKPELSAAIAKVLERTADVGHVRIVGGKHSMIRHHRVFDGLAADFATATMLGISSNPVVARVLGGETWVELRP